MCQTFKQLGSKLVRRGRKRRRLFVKYNRLEELGTNSFQSSPRVNTRSSVIIIKVGASYRKEEDSRAIFENVIEQSDMYRAKALISLAALEAAGW